MKNIAANVFELFDGVFIPDNAHSNEVDYSIHHRALLIGGKWKDVDVQVRDHIGARHTSGNKINQTLFTRDEVETLHVLQKLVIQVNHYFSVYFDLGVARKEVIKLMNDYDLFDEPIWVYLALDERQVKEAVTDFITRRTRLTAVEQEYVIPLIRDFVDVNTLMNHIQSRELFSLIAYHMGIFPIDADDFIRRIFIIVNGNAFKIQSKQFLYILDQNKLESEKVGELIHLFHSVMYDMMAGKYEFAESLAAEGYRWHDVFILLKKIFREAKGGSDVVPFINWILRWSKKCHKLHEESITQHIFDHDVDVVEERLAAISGNSNFSFGNLVKLGNYCFKVHLFPNQKEIDRVFVIRNGSIWIREKEDEKDE